MGEPLHRPTLPPGGTAGLSIAGGGELGVGIGRTFPGGGGVMAGAVRPALAAVGEPSKGGVTLAPWTAISRGPAWRPHGTVAAAGRPNVDMSVGFGRPEGWVFSGCRWATLLAQPWLWTLGEGISRCAGVKRPGGVRGPGTSGRGGGAPSVGAPSPVREEAEHKRAACEARGHIGI